MVQCKRCKLFVSQKKDDIIRCKGRCAGVYHKKCVQNLSHFIKNEICDGCAKNEESPKPQTPKLTIDVTKSTVESVLAEVNNKLEIIFNLKTQLQGLQETVEELRETVDFYSEQYQEMAEFKQTAQKKITTLENKNTYLQKLNDALEERISLLEVKEIENEIEIVGLHQLETENTREVVVKIADKFNLNPCDIENAKRVGREIKNEKQSRPRPIVVTLSSKDAKYKWLKQRKLRLTNRDILSIDNDQSIYINENLTKQMRKLFWNTKTSLKTTYKYIWVQNLKILVKKDENAKIHNIKTDSDVGRLLSAVNVQCDN